MPEVELNLITEDDFEYVMDSLEKQAFLIVRPAAVRWPR
jgi:hypothetical protein